ncbi:T9SS type A sorting domain-containing protein, partial [candidate division WOR-3 bacterium]|nr:T9SS type A sorting domain-containing protein [candidate division WOR-3 bacterium]
DNNGGGEYVTLMRTKYPFPPPESFSYWIKYDIADNYDFGYFEISEDGRFYYEVRDYVGNSTGWIEEYIDLRNFCDSVFGDSLQEIYYRFRLCTSYGSEIWIDDIINIGAFGFDSIIDTVTNNSYTFNSHPLGRYYITIRGENAIGWGDWCNPICFNVSSGTYVIDSDIEPKRFELYNVYPNPVYRSCVFQYSIPEGGDVKLSIFDIAGRDVVTLVDKHQSPGLYRISWDGKDSDRMDLSCGVYFYRLSVNDYISTRKLILVR